MDEVADDADRFVFPQALVRDTLYERQSGSRRVRLHHRIAQALEELERRRTPAELAHHFYESRHLDRAGQAVDYAVQAAEIAAAALAYEEAAAHYRRALERFDGEDRRRCELLLALGAAEARAGDPRAAATFDRAAELARGRFPELFGAGRARRQPGLVAGRRDRPPGDRAARGGARGARRRPADRAAAGAARQPPALRGRDRRASRS